MIRAAALVAGDGAKLQAILDAVYFKELPDFDLVCAISPVKDAYVMSRALNAGVPAYVVDPELFPTMTTHSMAVANKLKDLDIELVILAGYDLPLGVIPYQFKNRIIGTSPALCPAFEEAEGNVVALALERGCTVTGATAYFADGDGRVGSIILQKAVAIYPEDTVEALSRRITEEAEWPLLTTAVKLYCQKRLAIQGNRTVIKPELPPEEPAPTGKRAKAGVK